MQLTSSSESTSRIEVESDQRRRGRPRKVGSRQKVLASAIKLFGEKSFAEVRIEEIAVDAAIGKGSIYREFGSKESLYAIAITTGLRQLVSQMKATLRSAKPGPEAIAIVIREVSTYFWNHGEFFALLRDPRALPKDRLTEFRQERAGLTRLIVQVLRKGQLVGTFRDDLEQELVAEAVLGMIRGIRRHRSKRTQLAQAIALIKTLFLEGYRAGGTMKR